MRTLSSLIAFQGTERWHFFLFNSGWTVEWHFIDKNFLIDFTCLKQFLTSSHLNIVLCRLTFEFSQIKGTEYLNAITCSILMNTLCKYFLSNCLHAYIILYMGLSHNPCKTLKKTKKHSTLEIEDYQGSHANLKICGSELKIWKKHWILQKCRFFFAVSLKVIIGNPHAIFTPSKSML